MSNNEKILLSHYERQKIEYYLKLGLSRRAIARRIKRDHSVIVREIKRNSMKNGRYSADWAQKKAEKNSHHTNVCKLDKDRVLLKYVEDRLKDGWSPEQIDGRSKKHSPLELRGTTISHESIYQYIYEGNGKYLYKYLRRAQRKRKKQKSRRKQEKNPITERISIQERPETVNEKERLGDWEGDQTQYQKQKQRLSVQYERKAMLTMIQRVLNKSAEENEQALIRSLESLPPELHQSMTFDNGGENACHTKIRDIFQMNTYFCDPYSAWQKGGVENVIGLIRQYLPKNTDLSKVTDDDIYRVQELLNNRPRKSLNYLTPNEVINQHINPTSGASNS